MYSDISVSWYVFRHSRLFYRSLLRKRPIILRSLLLVATPYLLMRPPQLTSHIWMCHVTHMNESHHTWEWVMSQIWMSHATHMNESCHTYEWIMSHIWLSHVTHMNESCHTYEWVTPHIWLSHVTHMNESRHTYEWVMSHIWLNHVTHENESGHTYEWVTPYMRMSHVTHMNESRHTWEWVMSHIWMSHAIHENESCHTYEWVTLHMRWVMSPVNLEMSHVTHRPLDTAPTAWYKRGRFAENIEYKLSLLSQQVFTGTKKNYKPALPKLTKGQVSAIQSCPPLFL